MAKRYKLQSRQNEVADTYDRLPVNRPVAVYYRQSTEAQIGNISTSIQTVDMVKFLIQRGWPQKSVIMIDMDGGVSGSTKIDERPGMRLLFELITSAKIGAVACQDEDRLFRDVTQIQVNIFIEACRQSKVLVITPSMVYDFANELTGSFHARQFRFKSEMAAEYLNSVIRGKLHRAKQRLLQDGLWAGAGVPPGYMVDMRKALPDGIKNPDWRRYAPFQPYAQVVNEYFRIFLANAGYLNATLREIHEHGPYYPDPSNCTPPAGFKIHYKIFRYARGYCPGKTGLVGLLTNAAYIGHWVLNDRVSRWNNHPPVVPEDVFMRAFNYLSEVGVDGRKNRNYKPAQEHGRPSLETDRRVQRPLCSGMIFSEFEGQWRRVGANWVSPLKHYVYVLWAKGPLANYVWSKRADYVDEAVSRLVLEKLKVTFNSGVWEETVSTFRQDYRRARRLKLSQIRTLEQVKKNLLANLEALENRDMIRAAESRFEEAQKEHDRLQAELSELESEAKLLDNVAALRDAYEPALENWPLMSRSEKKIILQALIEQIEATPFEDHGLSLIIKWKDKTIDETILPRQATTGTQWLPSETQRLLSMVDQQSSPIEIAREFPSRTWSMIRSKVYSLRGKHSLISGRKPVKDGETYQEYLKRNRGQDSSGPLSFEGRSKTKHPCAPTIFPQDEASCLRLPGLRD